MNEIDKILKEAKEKKVDEEIIEYIEQMEFDNKRLERENMKLANGTSPSILQKYRESNKNIRQKNKELNEQIKKLQRKKSSRLAHLSKAEIGVYERMLDDFDRMNGSKQILFPGTNHPIFVRFNKLANKYPNREFIIHELSEKVNEKIDLVNFEIKTQQKNIEIWKECDKIAKQNPDTWEEDVDKKMANLYKVTTVEQIENEIEKLKKDKKTINKWNMLKDNILPKPKSDIEAKNNLFYEIFNEFDRIYDFCHYVGNIAQYKANIRVEGFSKEDIRSALTRELEKQIGLCEEPNTHNFFYSNGEGRLVPYELNRQLLKYVNENTTFVQYGKTTKYKKGDIINSKILFEEIPLYCNKVQYRNPNLVGFNNCFYDIVDGKIIDLNAKAPVLPLKNTKTELYLNKDKDKDISKLNNNGEVEIIHSNVVPIEDNAMKDIFMNCFTQQDRRTLLAYIGCALYDKGYTQRQESLFIMGKGGTGKTTLTKAICSIFYQVGHQLVTKLTDKNQFGFSMFADSDVVVIDEIQSAPREFAEKIKNISSSDALPVEKKHYDTITVPAESVPRVFFIGNNFSEKLYEASDSAGVKRRILIIIPTQPIQDLGYQWKDLITDSAKQWLVQQATLEYIRQGLYGTNTPIKSISDNQKLDRIELCTFPEQYFIKQHFELSYLDNGSLDTSELLRYDDFHSFIRKCIDDAMVESTLKMGVPQTFISHVKKCFGLDGNYNTTQKQGVVYFKAIVPKSEEAIKYLSE